VIGPGGPENASLLGLSAEYIIQQARPTCNGIVLIVMHYIGGGFRGETANWTSN